MGAMTSSLMRLQPKGLNYQGGSGKSKTIPDFSNSNIIDERQIDEILHFKETTETTHMPKPKTARILFKIRSRHPLSVFSTTVSFPYLHEQQEKQNTKDHEPKEQKKKQQNLTKIKLKNKFYYLKTRTNLSSSGISVCTTFTIVIPGSGSSKVSLTCNHHPNSFS